MVPTDPTGWLFVARGMFNSKPPRHRLVVEAAAHCLQAPETIVQGQQLLAFSLLELGETDSALAAFTKSVRLGNETDWQMLVELGLNEAAGGGDDHHHNNDGDADDGKTAGGAAAKE